MFQGRKQMATLFTHNDCPDAHTVSQSSCTVVGQ